MKIILKKILGVRSFAVWKKKKLALISRFFYRKKYNANDVVDRMKDMGLRSGDVVFIHCSMTEFYNYIGTADDLINQILNAIGNEGTLCMPAYPKFNPYIKDFFDVNKTPTEAGYFAEKFRTYPGVLRSINIQHSVCAYGKWAEYLTNEHHYSFTCWDEKSPYYKLTLLNAKVFSLGLDKAFIGTVFHCVDSLLYNKIQYFTELFDHEICYEYLDYNNKRGEHRFLSTVGVNRIAGNRLSIVDNYFDKSQYSRTKLSNLQIKVFNAKYVVDRLIELAYDGKIIYTHPRPNKNNFHLRKCDE